MHTYKLSYFEFRGLGEFIRMTFVQAGVQFEDHRVQNQYMGGNSDWKADTPFGQLPVLEIDGNIKLAQSCAIARYIARQHGLAGSSPIEEAQVDSLADAFKDFYAEGRTFLMYSFRFAEGDKDKAYQEKVVPAKDRLFPAMEKYLKESGSGFLVGKSVTWADFFLAERLELFHEIAPQIFEGHPEIPKWIANVMGLPKIKKWIEERPKSKF